MNLKEKAQEKLTVLSVGAKRAMLVGSTTAMVMVPTLIAHADEHSAASSGGKDLLAGDVWTAITAAFGDLATTTTKVVAIAVVTGCSIIGMSAAANYAMKKIKGMLSKAA